MFWKNRFAELFKILGLIPSYSKKESAITFNSLSTTIESPNINIGVSFPFHDSSDSISLYNSCDLFSDHTSSWSDKK